MSITTRYPTKDKSARDTFDEICHERMATAKDDRCTIIHGYKAFEPDMTCRGLQYEVDTVIVTDEKPVICERGFHFCKQMHEVYKYYPFDLRIPIAEVYGLVHMAREEYMDVHDSKRVTDVLYISRLLDDDEKVNLLNEGHPQLPLSDRNAFWRMLGNGEVHFALMSLGMRDDKCDCCGKNTYEGFWEFGIHPIPRPFKGPLEYEREPRVILFEDEFFEDHDDLKSFRAGAPCVFVLCKECQERIQEVLSQLNANGDEVESFIHLFNTRRQNYGRPGESSPALSDDERTGDN